MMKKWFGRTLLTLCVGLAVLAAINWGNIQRLMRTNSLFDADKIVNNFSHMDELFYSQTLPAIGPAHQWDIALQDLPDTVTIQGEVRDLQEFLERSATTSFLVIKGNDVLFEKYYLGTEQDDKRISWSVAKSFMSALIGTALVRGEIKSLQDKVTDYVPSLADTAYSEASIENVLQMSSGVAFDEDYMDRNSDINRMGRALAFGGSMDEFTLSLKTQDRAPGAGRKYVSIDTHVLGMVMRAASGETIHTLFTDRIWSKIGPSSDAYYLTDKDGRAFVLGGLNMTTRDYALFGALFRDNGRASEQLSGEQVIPTSWVNISTQDSATADVDGRPSGYGYQWWVPKVSHGDYYANGIYGQSIFIDPEADIVIVKTSANRDFKNPAPSGASYKTEQIDMMQSLVMYYSEMSEVEELNKLWENIFEAMRGAIPAGDGVQAFGLARAGGTTINSDAELPSAEELERIWQDVAEEMENYKSNNIEP